MMTNFTQLTPSLSMRITTHNPIVPSDLSISTQSPTQTSMSISMTDVNQVFRIGDSTTRPAIRWRGVERPRQVEFSVETAGRHKKQCMRLSKHMKASQRERQLICISSCHGP